MSEMALSDVRVLDLTRHVAGPFCTKMLADYGADVIKVERPDGGDFTRRMGPFPDDVPHPEKSGLFLHLNANKRGVTLNLKTATARGMLLELVKQVDVVVENFAPRVLPSLGLAYEDLERVNPGVILVSISNFGQTGPYRDYKASEIVLHGMGGNLRSLGLPEREPVKYGSHVALRQAGLIGAAATVAALFTREARDWRRRARRRRHRRDPGRLPGPARPPAYDGPVREPGVPAPCAGGHNRFGDVPLQGRLRQRHRRRQPLSQGPGDAGQAGAY